MIVLIENSFACSVGFPFDAIDEKENAEAPQRKREEATLSSADLLEFARRLVSFIRGSERCRLTVDCLYLALGDADLEGATMTSVAAIHSLTKAAISKRTRAIRKKLHLPVNANNKAARMSSCYAMTNVSPLRMDKSVSAAR